MKVNDLSSIVEFFTWSTAYSLVVMIQNNDELAALNTSPYYECGHESFSVLCNIFVQEVKTSVVLA